VKGLHSSHFSKLWTYVKTLSVDRFSLSHLNFSNGSPTTVTVTNFVEHVGHGLSPYFDEMSLLLQLPCLWLFNQDVPEGIYCQELGFCRQLKENLKHVPAKELFGCSLSMVLHVELFRNSRSFPAALLLLFEKYRSFSSFIFLFLSFFLCKLIDPSKSYHRRRYSR